MRLGLKASKPGFLFPTEVFAGVSDGPYMAHSIPVASDFYHPFFADFLRRWRNHPFQMHRKLWEFAFIENRLSSAGLLKPGSKGLCFGVGRELLPALFAAAGCEIVATDGPPEIVAGLWSTHNEFSASAADLPHEGVIDSHEFMRLVSYETCDMNAIPSHLSGFDFCWSACSLEHLGSLQHGLDFITNSLNTLKPGGLACHTTELNLSSNSETLERGATVLYRRKDLEAFVQLIATQGHEVETLIIPPMATPIDHHVDVPPYDHDPHLKLLLSGYVSTSVGICIRRGPSAAMGVSSVPLHGR